MVHGGELSEKAVRCYKGLLISLTQSMGLDGMELLLFLASPNEPLLGLTGDGIARYCALVNSRLVEYRHGGEHGMHGGDTAPHRIKISESGRRLVEAWLRGDREAIESVFVRGQPPTKD